MIAAMFRALGMARQTLTEERRQRPQRPRRAGVELEFLPAALEIVETPPSPLRRMLTAALIAFVAVAVAWSWFGMVDVVAIAPGKIIPAAKVKVVQPAEIGVVRAIRVGDGQRVRRGDLLVDLDSTIPGADRERLAHELAAVRVEIARLRAALDASGATAFTPPADADAALVARHRALLLAQLREHDARLSALDREMARRRAEHSAVQTTVDKLGKTVPLARDRAEAFGTLARQGFVARLAHVEFEERLIEQEQELATQRHRLTEAAEAIATLEEQRRHVEAEFRRTILGQIAEAETKAGSLEQELVKARQRHGWQRLVAPSDGVVQQLAVHTVGGVVTPAQPLMVIVPADGDLEIEAMVLNRDVGFVRAGQEAEIKLETFQFTRYGTVPGEVLHVSGDAVPDQRLGLVYPARISLARTAMDVDGQRVALAPGMAATAEIKIGERRLIEYVLSPVLRYRHEVFRER